MKTLNIIFLLGYCSALWAQNVGIGTPNPSEKLHIENGSIRIVDGTEGVGKVLVSDANGVGSWQSLAGSWAAYVMRANSASNTLNVTFTSSIINGTGGSVSSTNGRIYVPEAGLYRAIVYFDYPAGTVGSSSCTDIQIRGLDAGGTTLHFNCDDVGAKNSARKNGYMQVIWQMPIGSYFIFTTGNEATEGTISVERIN